MQQLVVGDSSSLAKAEAIVTAFPDVWSGRVVDVGCRRRELEAALKGRPVRYTGVDIMPGAEIVADLGQRLPFDDSAADTVVALDVLEHTDDIHRAFAELVRVASRSLIIALPNQYDLKIRLNILRGRPVSGKYGLSAARPRDRHRWFFSLNDARQFITEMATHHGWEVVDERAVVGPNKAKIAPLVGRYPNLLSNTYIALLRPVPDS